VSSRVVLLALVGTGRLQPNMEVYRLYHRWYGQFLTGVFPLHDATWQYPPGAALVMLAPGLLPLTYLQGFVVLTVAADAAVLAALALAGRRPGRSTAGAWLWAMGLPLMLGLPYIRYDVLATALAVAALLTVARRPGLGGALAGVGAMVKVWPALIVLGLPRGRTTRRAWVSAAVSAGGLALLLATAFRDAFGFLSAQHRRGVEIESLGGSALQVARLLGWHGQVRMRYGSMEFIGPYVSLVAQLSLLLTAVGFGWLLLWRVRARRWSRATPPDAALAAVLLFTTTSRVISPQYLVWLIGLAAVCLTLRQTTQRPVAVLLMLATGLTAAEYPLFFTDLAGGRAYAVAVLLMRNALLLAATVWSCVRLWRASEPQPLRLRRRVTAAAAQA
jgi:hypothetical protein